MTNFQEDIFEERQIRNVINNAIYNLASYTLDRTKIAAPSFTGALGESGKITPNPYSHSLLMDITISYEVFLTESDQYGRGKLHWESLAKLDGGINYAPAVEYGLDDTESTGYDYYGNAPDTWETAAGNTVKGYIFWVWEDAPRLKSGEFKPAGWQEYRNVLPVVGKNGAIRRLRPQGPETSSRPDWLYNTVQDIFKDTFNKRHGLMPYYHDWSIQGREKDNL